jgi:hypothetical protein
MADQQALALPAEEVLHKDSTIVVMIPAEDLAIAALLPQTEVITITTAETTIQLEATLLAHQDHHQTAVEEA